MFCPCGPPLTSTIAMLVSLREAPTFLFLFSFNFSKLGEELEAIAVTKLDDRIDEITCRGKTKMDSITNKAKWVS